ncbi:hypothetical protein ZWY2020_038288 [Hordeum vulgare]|nr:hypothetical protein ZWY2020_038288 [Hordeum vulgare]
MAATGSSRGRSGESMFTEELHQAGICMQESMRWIEAQEAKMEEIAHSDSDYDNLPDFRKNMSVLTDRIFHLWHMMRATQHAGWIGNEGESIETQSKIGDGGEMDSGRKSSKGSRGSASIELENLLHRSGILTDGEIGGGAVTEELLDFLAKETQEWIVNQSDSQLRWETAPELIAEILLKFEEVVVDIAKVFEEKKKIREEAMAVLRFGFRLPAFSEQIDELRHELCNFLRSFSSENKDIRSTMMKFISEPYLSRISKLQLISDRITMLQRMDSDFYSKVKSTIIKLKSETFLSAMEDELRRGGQEDSMEMEEKRFTAYHLYWERIWGRDGHSFENQTILSPMQFTHCTPHHIPIEAVAGSTLQIYSIKVSLVEPQKLPLEVYGVVAARDAVDRHRNPLFLRSREHCQILKENDSLLHLTGPVRAIVSTDTVYIEIQLIVKGRTKSEDTTLISTFSFYNADNSYFGEQIEWMRGNDEDKNMGGKVVNPHEAAKVAEEHYFIAYRRGWERRSSNFGSFEDPTLLSPMFFTRSLPGHTQVGAEVGRTMQVYYIKMHERRLCPWWPLKVYGVVAARDVVDYRATFSSFTRDDCQILTRQDSFLHLTGPSRAIMSEDTVTLEVHLKLKGTVESKDTTLISKAFFYDYDGVSVRLLRGLCEIELCCDHLEQSHQATILGVRILRGSLPCGKIKVVCSVLPEDNSEGNGKHPSGHVLLFDSRAEKMPVSEDGYLDLSRQVVSVKSGGRLEIWMQAGDFSGSVVFPSKFSNISQKGFELGGCKVEINVAWSLLIESQYDISVMGSIQPYAWESIPRRPVMKLVEDVGSVKGHACI